MSKKKQSTKTTAAPPKAVRAAQQATPPREIWQQPEESQPAMYRRAFTFLAIAVCALTLLMSQFSGINGDDEYQVDYSEKIVNYYQSAGQDTSATYIEKGKMHFYGGTFEFLAGGINRALGYTQFHRSYHRVRHGLIALFGCLAMLFTALLVRQLAGWRAAVLALLFIFLSPRFLGHAFMNPKDIPFAAGFAMSLFFLVRWLRQLPGWDWRTLAGLSIGIGISIGMRAGGILVVAYLGLFAGIDFLLRYGLGGVFSRPKTLLMYALTGASASLVGYVLAVLTWPAALQAPIQLPLEALAEFSQLGVRIRVLFEGLNVMSDETPWYYPLQWIVKTIPFYALVGVAGGLLLLPLMWRRYPPVGVSLVAFAALFPLLYVIYKDSTLHDGWRHLMFVYPGMVALATLFWVTLEAMLRTNKVAQYLLWGILALAMLEPAVFIARNPTLPYVYFNPIGGGLAGAYGHYETDYWGVSVRQAIDWMEEEGILRDDMTDTVRIATSFYYNVSRELGDGYRDRVKVDYVRFNARYALGWDYGIFPSRYIRGPHLLSGNWPNSKAVHTVKANGVPMLAIERDLDRHAYKAEVAMKGQDFATAIAEFTAELEKHPDNELALAGLASAHLNTGSFDAALQRGQEALKVAPDNETALYLVALAYLNQQDVNNAMATLNELLKISPDNAQAHYYLAMCHRARNELSEALRSVLLAIEKSPRLKMAYTLAAELYQQQGDANTAARYQQAANSL